MLLCNRSQTFKAAFQPYCKSELLVEVRRARVNRDGFRLVILEVRLETTRKHGFIVQPACLVYEFVRLLVRLLVQMCAQLVKISGPSVLVEEL